MGANCTDFGGQKILIAEDVDSNRLYYKIALRKCNAIILWAKTGAEAVEIFKNEPGINLAIMDLAMPEMNGFEAIRLIKQIKPDIPIIVQSASVISEVREKSFEAGCNEFLPKPVPQNLLIETIGKYLIL